MKDFQPVCRDRESFSSVGNFLHGERGNFQVEKGNFQVERGNFQVEKKLSFYFENVLENIIVNETFFIGISPTILRLAEIYSSLNRQNCFM